MINEVIIDTEYIKLGALLKLGNLVSSGAEAKIYIMNGEVKVNGEVDTRRGKKIYEGDTVSFRDQKLVVKSNAHK